MSYTLEHKYLYDNATMFINAVRETHGESGLQLIGAIGITQGMRIIESHNPEKMAQDMLENHNGWRGAVVAYTMFSAGKPPRSSKILEGVDGSGKTTASLELQEQLGLPIVHFGRLGPDVEFAFDIYSMFLDINGLIMDRSFISSIMYHDYEEISRYKEQKLIDTMVEKKVQVELFSIPDEVEFARRRPTENYQDMLKINAKYFSYVKRLVAKGINVRIR